MCTWQDRLPPKRIVTMRRLARAFCQYSFRRWSSTLPTAFAQSLSADASALAAARDGGVALRGDFVGIIEKCAKSGGMIYGTGFLPQAKLFVADSVLDRARQIRGGGEAALRLAVIDWDPCAVGPTRQSGPTVTSGPCSPTTPSSCSPTAARAPSLRRCSPTSGLARFPSWP